MWTPRYQVQSTCWFRHTGSRHTGSRPENDPYLVEKIISKRFNVQYLVKMAWVCFGRQHMGTSNKINIQQIFQETYSIHLNKHNWLELPQLMERVHTQSDKQTCKSVTFRVTNQLSWIIIDKWHVVQFVSMKISFLELPVHVVDPLDQHVHPCIAW